MNEKEMLKAVKAGDVAKVREYLLANPALAHVRDKDQSTPLHLAAWKGYPEIIDLLVEAGADLQAHNENFHWGTTAMHAAAHGNQAACATALIRHGADVNAFKSTGEGRPLSETNIHNATAARKVLLAARAVE